MSKQTLGEELYSVLADLLNRKMNRTVQDSVRGEYGVLRYLLYVQDNVSAGFLTEQFHVVPGRMTDILKALESKGFIERYKDEEDKRKVNVKITEKGKQEAEKRRNYIAEEYEGLFEILGERDTRELIRLIKIVLSYSEKISI